MLHHVGIEVAPADIERSVEFWELLGFELVEPPRGAERVHLAGTGRDPDPPDADRVADRAAARPHRGRRRRLRARPSPRWPSTASRSSAAANTGARPAPCVDRPRRPPGRADGRARRRCSALNVRRPARRPGRSRCGYDAPVRYPVEDFTAEERALLAPHFTNLDRPVFALVNLPETVKGALFARYSRYSGTVRRLYLEEFAADARGRRPALRRRPRASAPRGSTNASSSATATTRSPRSAAPTSPASGSRTCSPRCCSAAGSPPTSSSRPATSPTTSRCPRSGGLPLLPRRASSAPSSAPRWTRSSRSTRARCEQVEDWAAERWPRGDDEPEGPWQRSIRAKALDLLRGLLPAATLSHVGIYASGQAYEQMLLRLMASPLPEAREYGGMILSELKQVMPSFVSRVERPDRGGEWISYLQQRREQTEQWVSRLGLDRRGGGEATPVGRAGPRRRQRREPARLLPARVGLGARDRGPRPPRRPRPRRARRAARRDGRRARPTAATAPAAASRRCATASRSSPTTAPSATCSATAC